MKNKVKIFLETLILSLIIYGISLIANKEIDMSSLTYGLLIALYVDFRIEENEE